MDLKPGARFELNARSGNAGRKGFVLYQSNTSLEDVLVRFDGFQYNSITTKNYLTILPDEAFRP